MIKPSTRDVPEGSSCAEAGGSVRSRPGRFPRKEDARNKIIGQCLRDARLMHGWSMQQMAKEAGVHWSSVGKYEKGQQVIPVAYVYLVSRLTGVPIGQLFEKGDARPVSSLSLPETDDVSNFIRHWLRIPEPNLRRAVANLVRNIAQARS